jgi:hypothetical protein
MAIGRLVPTPIVAPSLTTVWQTLYLGLRVFIIFIVTWPGQNGNYQQTNRLIMY